MGCGRTAPKRVLMRLALVGDTVVADPQARQPGRGAYVCDAACFEQALSQRAFGRAFRGRATTISPLTDALESPQH